MTAIDPTTARRVLAAWMPDNDATVKSHDDECEAELVAGSWTLCHCPERASDPLDTDPTE